MELRQIQYIMQLFKDGNITKASHKLFISQQGLSKSINRIEDELGFTLFERSSSGVTPTEAGLSLYHYFDKVATACQDLDQAIEEIRHEHLLKIIGCRGFALSLEGGLYPHYHELHPEIRIQYEEDYNDMIPDHLQNHKAELAFIAGPIPKSLQAHQLIRRDHLCAIMNRNNPLALKRKLSISDLHGEKLLLLDQQRNLNSLFLKAADAKNIAYTIHSTVGISEYLPLIYSLNMVGFATRELFLHYDYPEISYLPVKEDPHLSHYVETHLVSLRDSNLSIEAREFIDYVITVHKKEESGG